MRGRLEGDEATSRWSRSDWWGVVLEAPDAIGLAAFYAELLGWEIHKENPDEAAVAPPNGVAYLGFQTAPGFTRPVWPAVDGGPRMTMHLDFEVADLQVAVVHALDLGATEAAHQPQPNVRVLLDPAGHPFCLYVDDSDAG